MPNGKVRVSSLYGAGAAIGFSPAEVKAMSMWEFTAAYNGFVRANTPRDGNRLSEAEAADLFDWIEVGNDNGAVRCTTVYDWDGLRLVPAGKVTFPA